MAGYARARVKEKLRCGDVVVFKTAGTVIGYGTIIDMRRQGPLEIRVNEIVANQPWLYVDQWISVDRYYDLKICRARVGEIELYNVMRQIKILSKEVDEYEEA